jgi:hypothetical protein
MPLAHSQPLSSSATEADAIVMVELSANLYGSWGASFGDAIGMPLHQTMLSMWLWVYDRAIETEATVFLETVVDGRENTDPVKPHSFRLWIPLREGMLAQFVTCVAGALPVWVEPPPNKRMRPEPKRGAAVLKTKADVLAAVRAYSGGAALIDISTAPTIGGETLPPHHIIEILSAKRRLTRCQSHYAAGGVEPWQRMHSLYLKSPDNGRTMSLQFPEEVVKRGLVRELKPGFVRHADDLLSYHLPHFSPTKSQTSQAQQAVAHATGCDDVEVETDPTAYAKLALSEKLDDVNALQALLGDIYPIIERVKRRNEVRVATSGLRAVAKELVHELNTLYSVPVDGVPSVYCTLKQEKVRRKLALSQTTAAGPSIALARRMFWRKEADALTGWGNLFASIISGICTAARMLPPQRKLWLLLFLRSHKCIANHVGSNAYIICCGPPETGKSEACRFWLACMPNSLQRMNDGQSAKAHTAMDPDTDMRVCFQDELQEHISTDALGDNAKQTLISNGLLVTKRLRKQEDGSFTLEETKKAGRALTVTCTNNLSDVKDAVKSRATIVAVPALKTTETSNSASMLASIGVTKANALRDGFALFCQALTSLQVDFWALEAAGLLSVDDRMLLLYKVVSDKLAPKRALSARKMVEIRHMAASIMVLDLCSKWHRLGVGAAAGHSESEQAIFFAENAVIRMEHVIAAVGVSTASTCVDHELKSVQQTLKEMIRLDQMGYAVLSSDQTAFVLATTRKRLSDDVSNSNTALGPGLTKTLLRSIQQGSTNGRPNLRFDVEDRQELVLLNRHYVATFFSAQDDELVSALAKKRDMAVDAWVGDYLVFRSSVRHEFTDTSDAGVRVSASLSLSQPELRLTLAIMEDRKTPDNKPMWKLHDTYAVARPTAHTTAQAVEWADGTHRLRKTEQCVLTVHKSLFDRPQHMATTPLDKTFGACLSIAGGYQGKRVVVGIGANHKGAATVCPQEGEINLRVRNPMYTNMDDVQVLIGDDAGPDDSVFPRAKEYLTFTDRSACEARCFADFEL